jgi:hypothetical protein
VDPHGSFTRRLAYFIVKEKNIFKIQGGKG